jgi:hypothetical protein
MKPLARFLLAIRLTAKTSRQRTPEAKPHALLALSFSPAQLLTQNLKIVLVRRLNELDK